MTDMTLEQMAAKIRSHADFVGSLGGPGELMDSVELSDIAEAIDAHLAKAADYERAVTEQAMLTECVSVTGRDPSDVIRDVVQWHVSNSAQPVESVGEDSREFVLRAMAMNYSDRHAWDHLDADACRRGADEIKALRGALEAIAERHGDKSVDGQIARAALAHPRPTGEEAFIIKYEDTDEADEVFIGYGARYLAFKRYEQRSTAWNAHLFQRIHCNTDVGSPLPTSPTGEQAGEVVPIPMILLCPACGMQHVDAPEPKYADNGADDTEWNNPPHRSHLCHGCGSIWRPADVATVGVERILTRGSADSFDPTQPRPVGVPAGEVAWIDHTPSGVVLRTLGECKRLEDLPHGTKLYAQPRPVGVPEGYRLVPVEPTDDMCRNAREKIGIGSNVAHHVWHWMIAAAPAGEVG